jgi:hypothetical protein
MKPSPEIEKSKLDLLLIYLLGYLSNHFLGLLISNQKLTPLMLIDVITIFKGRILKTA